MAPEQAWGQTREIGPPDRPVRARGDPLRDAHRPPAVPGADRAGDAGAGPEPGAGPAHEAPAQGRRRTWRRSASRPSRRSPPSGSPTPPRWPRTSRRFLDGEPILARPVVRAGAGRGGGAGATPGSPGLAARRGPAGRSRSRPGRSAFAVSLKTLNGELGRVVQGGGKGAAGSRRRTSGRRSTRRNERDRRQGRRGRGPRRRKAGPREGRGAGPGGVRPEPQRPGGPARPQRPAQPAAAVDRRGRRSIREELISTTLTGLEATIASLEQLGTVARDKEGFALATRTLAGINQRAGLIAMEYGKYDETARYFRRMEELSEQLAAADPDALEPAEGQGQPSRRPSATSRWTGSATPRPP